MKYSSGNWQVRADDFDSYTIYNEEIDIAEVLAIGEYSEQGEANAKVMAASKDLLEALSSLYELLNVGQPPGNDDLDKAFAAIKKATT